MREPMNAKGGGGDLGSTRCLFLLEVPVSYRTGWLAHLRAESGLDVHVVYLSRNQPDRPWEAGTEAAGWIHYAEALDLGGTSRGFFPRLSRGLAAQISRIDPDIVIVPGWAHPATWQAVAWCRRHRRPYGVMFESWKSQGQTRVPAPISGFVRQRVLAGADLVLPVGERARSFSSELGRADAQVVHGNTCDVETIINETDGVERRTRPTALFVGRLMPHKGTELLMDSFEPLAASGVGVRIIGDGPARSAVEAAAADNSLVEVLGPQSPEDVRTEIASAHVVIVPSLEEPWGVVVHEALAGGTPVVATDAVGSTADLMTSDAVGRVVEPGVRQIVDGVVLVLESADDETADACRAAARQVTYQSASLELLDAIASLTGQASSSSYRGRAKAPLPASVVIDARTAQTGGGATVLRVIDEQLVPSLIGIDVDVRRPPTSRTNFRNHPGTPLTSRRNIPNVVLSLSEASNLGAGASGKTIMMARNWNCWTPAETLRRRVRSAVARRNAGVVNTVLVATEVFAGAIRPAVTRRADVEVLPFGIGAQFTPDGEAAEGQYFLCVGDWYPWKKFELAVEAFAEIAGDLPETSLRIAGRPVHPDYQEATLARARTLGIENRVEVLGAVGPGELATLYRGAIATVATSELESFGHPYLEALACGSPLIGRRMPVTEELVGGAGVLTDGQPRHFAAAMLEAFKNPSAERRRAGLERAAEFSWDRYVARLRELIVDGVG